jgi:hypothetical protein
MAEKRARIDAVLAVTGASALFTQDMEAPEVAERDAERGTIPRTDGKEPAQVAKSWKDWQARMEAMEIPQPSAAYRILAAPS